MSACTAQKMTNNHGFSPWSRLASLVRTWHTRSVERRDLAHFTDRDLHDLGLSWSEAEYEIGKPFWRP